MADDPIESLYSQLKSDVGKLRMQLGMGESDVLDLLPERLQLGGAGELFEPPLYDLLHVKRKRKKKRRSHRHRHRHNSSSRHSDAGMRFVEDDVTTRTRRHHRTSKKKFSPVKASYETETEESTARGVSSSATPRKGDTPRTDAAADDDDDNDDDDDDDDDDSTGVAALDDADQQLVENDKRLDRLESQVDSMLAHVDDLLSGDNQKNLEKIQEADTQLDALMVQMDDDSGGTKSDDSGVGDSETPASIVSPRTQKRLILEKIGELGGQEAMQAAKAGDESSVFSAIKQALVRRASRGSRQVDESKKKFHTSRQRLNTILKEEDAEAEAKAEPSPEVPPAQSNFPLDDVGGSSSEDPEINVRVAQQRIAEIMRMKNLDNASSDSEELPSDDFGADDDVSSVSLVAEEDDDGSDQPMEVAAKRRITQIVKLQKDLEASAAAAPAESRLEPATDIDTSPDTGIIGAEDLQSKLDAVAGLLAQLRKQDELLEARLPVLVDDGNVSIHAGGYDTPEMPRRKPPRITKAMTEGKATKPPVKSKGATIRL